MRYEKRSPPKSSQGTSSFGATAPVFYARHFHGGAYILKGEVALADQEKPLTLQCSRAAGVIAAGRVALCVRCAHLPGRASYVADRLAHHRAKPLPKDADVLVTIEDGLDLGPLASAARRLKGTAQQMNLGADIFLANAQGRYLGRICHYRECHPRVACRAQHCGRQAHLNDDFQVVTLGHALIASPPVELWPEIRRRVPVPGDVEELLLAGLAPVG